MRALAQFFLRAKHWQIFLLVFGIGSVGGTIALLIPLLHERSPEAVFSGILPFGLVMAFCMSCQSAWLWSLGSFLNSISPPAFRMRPRFFNFAVLFPVAYVFVFFAIFQSAKPLLILAIFPLHFFTMFCLFYDFFFVSRSLAAVETGKLVTFPDYAGRFFLFWFFPIGVWFVQPRINRLEAQPFSPQGAVTSVDMPLPAAQAHAAAAAYTLEIPAGTPPVHAGFWRRLAATLIDSLILFFPVSFLAVFASVVVRIAFARMRPDPGTTSLVAFLVVPLLLPWVYFSFLESSRLQATIGKNALRLYVTDLEGHRLIRGRAMGRNLAKFLSNVTLGVGYIMCGFTKKKQALHDVVARCLVLRRPKS